MWIAEGETEGLPLLRSKNQQTIPQSCFACQPPLHKGAFGAFLDGLDGLDGTFSVHGRIGIPSVGDDAHIVP